MLRICFAVIWLGFAVSILFYSDEPLGIAFWAMLILANMWLIHAENKR